MIFKAQIDWYDEYDEKIRSLGVYVSADNYANAMGKLAIYYGENDIEKISIEPFSPDDFLEFDMNDQDDKERYIGIEKKAEDVCW